MIRILIDINLSPKWVEVFKSNGFEAVSWSSIGKPEAPDKEIFEYAKRNSFVIFTNDLDFGTMLALTGSDGPSVIQVRTQDVSPGHLEPILIPTIKQYFFHLEAGALIVIDEEKQRIKILPLSTD